MKAWRALHFIMRILKKRNNNTKCLAYRALVRPVLVHGAVCWGPYREGQVSALNWVQKREAKFANNINWLGNFGTAKIDSPNMRPFQRIHRGTGFESDRKQISKTMLSE